MQDDHVPFPIGKICSRGVPRGVALTAPVPSHEREGVPVGVHSLHGLLIPPPTGSTKPCHKSSRLTPSVSMESRARIAQGTSTATVEVDRFYRDMNRSLVMRFRLFSLRRRIQHPRMDV